MLNMKIPLSDQNESTPLLQSVNNNDNITCSDQVVSKQDQPGRIQFRYIVVLLSTFGCFCAYSVRTSMGIALVCMVNHTALTNRLYANGSSNDSEVLDVCTLGPNETESQSNSEDGPFVWDEHLQGIILSSFFWGYAVPQIFAGSLADRFGGKWIWGCCLLLSSIFTLMIPWAANNGAVFVIILRALCGVSQGVTFPTLCSILSKWVPDQQRTKLVTLANIGSGLGIIVCFPLSATLCSSTFIGGWPSIFYLFGSLGVLWFLLWSAIVSSYPDNHPCVSVEEKVFIQSSITSSHLRNVKIPWARILKSPPFISLWFVELFGSFKYFMLLTQLPTYLKVVMGFGTKENGYINLVPYAITIPVSLLSAWFADACKNSGMLRTVTIRKCLSFISTMASALGLLGVTVAGCDRGVVVMLFWISVAADAVGAGGASINPFDLSPSFTGTLKGIANTFTAFGGILAPYVVGTLINDNNTLSQWNIAFYLASGVSIFGYLIFLILGSGEIQPWDALYKENDIGPINVSSDESNFSDQSK